MVITLPQAPFFAEVATARDILSPSSLPATDDLCQSALEAVGLWNLVVSRGGLDTEFNSSSLSHGQRQLLSLARAVTRVKSRHQGSGGLLLLDEFNSSVDAGTDQMMQDVVMKEFASYTVVCVAHQLVGLMEYDRVVVMDRGRVAEVGTPQGLLKQPSGKFRELFEVQERTRHDDGERDAAGLED